MRWKQDGAAQARSTVRLTGPASLVEGVADCDQGVMVLAERHLC